MIYLLQSNISERGCIGQTINYQQRIRCYRYESNHNPQSFTNKWYAKYKPTMKPFFECKPEDNDKWEMFFIKFFRNIGMSLTNTLPGGNKPPNRLGSKMSLESRIKISNTLKGHLTSQETRDLISKNTMGKNKGKKAWNLGIAQSKEAREKNRISHLKYSKETIKNIIKDYIPLKFGYIKLSKKYNIPVTSIVRIIKEEI